MDKPTTTQGSSPVPPAPWCRVPQNNPCHTYRDPQTGKWVTQAIDYETHPGLYPFHTYRDDTTGHWRVVILEID